MNFQTSGYTARNIDANLKNPGGGVFYETVHLDPQIDVVKARLSFKFGAREPEHEPLK